jgi:hypothetical protein
MTCVTIRGMEALAGKGASGTLAPMVHNATPGESAGHRARRFHPSGTALRRAAVACALLMGLVAGPVAAGSLYRCTGSTGETVFSGTTAGYKDCKRIGSTGPVRPARSTAVASPSAGASGPTSPPFQAGLAAPPQSQAQSRAQLQAGSNAARSSSPRTAVFEPVAGPPSLTGVIGSVALAPTTGASSLVGVTGGVVGGAEGDAPEPLVLPAVPAATPSPAVRNGQWDYKESASADLTAAAVPETPKGSRVLRGAVYRITRADGGVEYTNIPQGGGGGKGGSIKMLFTYIATCAACDVHSKVDWNSVALNVAAYGDTIRAASSEFSVDEALLRAVIHAESAFNPRALSVAGAQGLMQLIPGTARDMGVLDAFDTGQNIRGGARYLALLLRTFNGNERLAAAAYNAGPGAVQKYNGVPPYDETQVYVERVGVLRKRYSDLLKPHTAL